jgi:hypothetical protein
MLPATTDPLTDRLIVERNAAQYLQLAGPHDDRAQTR